MMIDGKTRTLGLLGDPVEHTMSPLIHNTLSEKLGLNNVYVPFHTKAENLEAAVKGAYALNILGSGVGKTGMAFLLQNMFEKQGKKSLIISGDNYPHRIPMYNDAERIARFRMSGLNGLITERLYTDEIKEKLLELQKAGRDAEEQEDMQWLSIYQKY